MLPPGWPPSRPSTGATSTKLYATPEAASTAAASAASVALADVTPSSAGPEPSCTSCRKTRSGTSSLRTMSATTRGMCAESGARFSAL